MWSQLTTPFAGFLSFLLGTFFLSTTSTVAEQRSYLCESENVYGYQKTGQNIRSLQKLNIRNQWVISPITEKNMPELHTDSTWTISYSLKKIGETEITAYCHHFDPSKNTQITEAAVECWKLAYGSEAMDRRRWSFSSTNSDANAFTYAILDELNLFHGALLGSEHFFFKNNAGFEQGICKPF